MKLAVVDVRVLVQVVDAVGVEHAGAALDAVHLVALLQQEFGQVGAVLAGDAGDHARFTYVNGNNAALNLIEIVDNINSATRIDQPVPAPATLSLVGAALLGLGVARRRKA
jgi:hypothetical protein